MKRIAFVLAMLAASVVVRHGPSFSCGPSDCVGGGIAGLAFDLQELAPTYAATITMSFSYRTTPGDGGRIWLSLDDGPGPRDLLAPGKVNLAASAIGTTTTATWIARGLTAGTTLSIGIGLSGGRGGGGIFSISTSDLVLSIEGVPTT
jgi:hypothetical protein